MAVSPLGQCVPNLRCKPDNTQNSGEWMQGKPMTIDRRTLLAVAGGGTQDDNAVPVSKSIEIFSRWTAGNLPAELHIYERGGHGFGMMQHHLPVDDWTTAFAAWLMMHGWLNQAKAP
jgi:hypothetical protein